MSEDKALPYLKRIADAVETIAATMVTRHVDANTTPNLLYQLAGGAQGFADELGSILNEGLDNFQKANALRGLHEKAERIAAGYKRKADEATEFGVPGEPKP